MSVHDYKTNSEKMTTLPSSENQNNISKIISDLNVISALTLIIVLVYLIRKKI